jgi:hypothetical protein
LFNLIGRPSPNASWPALPEGMRAERITEHEAWRADPEVHALDREVLGFTHSEDHGFVLEEPRHPFAYRSTDGRLAAYGYAGDVGRVGPIAVTNPELLAPVLGHLLRAVHPETPGRRSAWRSAPGCESRASRSSPAGRGPSQTSPDMYQRHRASSDRATVAGGNRW